MLTEGQKRYRRYHESYVRYQIEHKAKIRAQQRQHTDEKRFGLDREDLFKTLGSSCADCGMTNAEHIQKWGRRISIHHKDGNGRYSSNPNNTVDNYEVLCLSCHSKKDYQRKPRHRLKKARTA